MSRFWGLTGPVPSKNELALQTKPFSLISPKPNKDQGIHRPATLASAAIGFLQMFGSTKRAFHRVSKSPSPSGVSALTHRVHSPPTQAGSEKVDIQQPITANPHF